MKVYQNSGEDMRLVGRADVPDNVGPVFEVPLFGPAATIIERYTIGNVTLLPEGGSLPIVVRAVLLAPDQPGELLPGWQPLAS